MKLRLWECYRANNGGSVLTAIDNVLQNHYNTNLANAFPAFTWHNYFMNSGTYDLQVTNVYTNVETLLPAFTGPQWQLFRSHLQRERKDWQAGQAGMLTARIDQYPHNGPLPNYSAWVENLGAGYVEFIPRNNHHPIAPGTVLSVTIAVEVPAPVVGTNARVSVLPIINFLGPILPNNTFLTPRFAGSASSNYSFRIANFDQCDRVTVIASVLGGGKVSFRKYTAQLVPQPPSITPLPPCFLQLP